MNAMLTAIERRAELLARLRGERPDGVLPMLEMLSAAGSPICALCAVGHGGDWLTKTHVAFEEAACMVCGKTKATCSAAHWRWNEVDASAPTR